jgi:acyl-CoA synthetase (AMP-forming)/AMP-acid ligase II
VSITASPPLILPVDVANYGLEGGNGACHYSKAYTPYVWFAQTARRIPGRVALTQPGGRLTYGELDDMARAFARGLLRLGIKPGEAIAVASGNRWELAPLFLASSAIGISFTAFNPMLTTHELSYQIGVLRPRLFIAEGYTTLEAVLDADDGGAIEPNGDEWGPLMVRFSSGTTGKPKAMVSSQRAQLENYRLMIGMLDMRPGDVHLVTGPLGHAALHAGLPQLLVGGTVTLMGRFDKTCFWQDCAETGATNALMVPTMISGALEHPGDAPNLRRLLSTAATLAPIFKQRLAERFPHVGLVEAYGASEFGYVSALFPDEHKARPRSVGRPLPGQEVAIFDDVGEECPPGEVGMIHVRSTELVTGHIGPVRPEPTIAEQRGDGWMTSGDLGYLDEEGFLFISDRRSDLIISGGLNVYPAEVEAVLSEIPGVREVAVVGIAHEHWGQRVVAYVDADTDERTIAAHCAGRLARYKIPQAIHNVGPLPRTSSGKTSRMLTREMAARGEFPA